MSIPFLNLTLKIQRILRSLAGAAINTFVYLTYFKQIREEVIRPLGKENSPTQKASGYEYRTNFRRSYC